MPRRVEIADRTRSRLKLEPALEAVAMRICREGCAKWNAGYNVNRPACVDESDFLCVRCETLARDEVTSRAAPLKGDDAR